MKLIIPGTLPTMNEIINTSKRNKYAYESMKNEAIERVSWSALEQLGRTKLERADFVITWYRPNQRTDKDNVVAGQKYIFDGLQAAGMLENDGWKQIGNITHKFDVDKHNPRVEIELQEVVSSGSIKTRNN